MLLRPGLRKSFLRVLVVWAGNTSPIPHPSSTASASQVSSVFGASSLGSLTCCPCTVLIIKCRHVCPPLKPSVIILPQNPIVTPLLRIGRLLVHPGLAYTRRPLSRTPVFPVQLHTQSARLDCAYCRAATTECSESSHQQRPLKHCRLL